MMDKLLKSMQGGEPGDRYAFKIRVNPARLMLLSAYAFEQDMNLNEAVQQIFELGWEHRPQSEVAPELCEPPMP